MKKLLLFSTLLLGGCVGMGQLTPTTIGEFVKLVQTYSLQGCKFVPTAETIMNIYAQGQFVVAFSMAKAICDAVVMPTGPGVLTRAQGIPRVSGVVVRGQFIRR